MKSGFSNPYTISNICTTSCSCLSRIWITFLKKCIWWLMISIWFHEKKIFFRFLGRFGWSNLAYILSHFPFRCCDSHRIKKIGVFSIWRWTWLFTNASRSSKRIQLVFKQSFANFVGVYIYEKYARRIVSVEFLLFLIF